MNPIKWIVQDLKTDYQAIKEIVTGKGGTRIEEMANEFKQIKLRDALQENMMWLLLIIVAIAAGWTLATGFHNAKISEITTNAIIIIADKTGERITVEDITSYNPALYGSYPGLPSINISITPP